MPIPNPGTGEKESEFITRCMSDATMEVEHPDRNQRIAVCYEKWRNKE